jgi:hypothetical protein
MPAPALVPSLGVAPLFAAPSILAAPDGSLPDPTTLAGAARVDALAVSAASPVPDPEKSAAQAAALFDQSNPAPPANIFVPSAEHSALITAIVGEKGLDHVMGWLTKLGAPARVTADFHRALFAAASRDEVSAARVLAAQHAALVISIPLARETDPDIGPHEKAAIIAAALLRALPSDEGGPLADELTKGLGYKGSPAWLAYGDAYRFEKASPLNEHWYRRWRRRLAYAEESLALLNERTDPDAPRLRALTADPMFAWLPPNFQKEFIQRSLPPLARTAGVEATSEFELAGRGVLQLIATTPTGTLAPFTKRASRLSKWKNRGRELWKDISPSDKQILVDSALRRRRKSFWQKRSLPIVQVRDTAVVDFGAQSIFQGSLVQPGPTYVPLKPYFRDGIELSGPLSGTDSLEVHYRSIQTAGRAMLDGRRLVEALGFPVAGLHQHVPVPLPDRIKAEPEFESLRLSDYYRRLNLFLEMTDVVSGAGISENRRKGVVFFGYLTRARLAGVFRYLRGAGRGRPVKTSDDFKMAWIGFWGQDKYDKPGMIGFESRALSKNKSVPLMYGFQDRMQLGLLSGDYGMKPDAFKLWLDQRAAEGMSGETALTGALYQRSWAEALRSPEAAGMSPELSKWLKSRRHNQEYKMLFFDWSREPALMGRPEVLDAVRRAQAKAKATLMSGELPDMSEFILGSGLYDALADSLDLVER